MSRIPTTILALTLGILMASWSNQGHADDDDDGNQFGGIFDSDELEDLFEDILDDDDDDFESCGSNITRRPERLLDCVTVEGVRRHQRVLQAIADANGGLRTSATPGYDISAYYVAWLMDEAGYNVELQPFDFESSIRVGSSASQQTTPDTITYAEGVDFDTMSQTEPGDETAPVTAVDLDLGPAGDGIGNTSTSGCESDDFIEFPAGNIALIQRGSCSFQAKAENAADAGAVGAIIFNQGNEDNDDRRGLIGGTLSAAYSGGIPVLEATYARGIEWSETDDLSLRVFANVFRGIATSYNVLAESRSGDDENVVMVGAHLDSVDDGPGINDNGSGSSAILEVALQMADARLNNKVRFAWWGAEESGLVGSTFYIAELSQGEIDDIALYLNFDMIGSSNFARFIYDGDGSTFPEVGPPGSAAIEKFYEDFYMDRGLASEPTRFSGRSDYGPFIAAGIDIPAGGLFTGAEGIKTEAQVALYGGTEDEQYDPCYHLACDTFDNVNLDVLSLNADAVAASTLHFAMSTESLTESVTLALRTARSRTSQASAVQEYLGPLKVR